MSRYGEDLLVGVRADEQPGVDLRVAVGEIASRQRAANLLLDLVFPVRSGGAREGRERLQIRVSDYADGQELLLPDGHSPMVTLLRGRRIVCRGGESTILCTKGLSVSVSTSPQGVP